MSGENSGFSVKVLCGFAMGAVLLSAAAWAQDEEEKQEERPVVRQEIVVSASMPEMAEERVLSSRELEERAESDLGEALRHEPGLAAVRRGAINLEPSVRGLQENQVGIFVDGTRTFAAGPARMDSDLSHVSPHAVSTVQVVKGPYALTWGAGALSAIQLERARSEFASDGFRLDAEHLNSLNPFRRKRILEPGRSVFGGLEVRF